MSKFTKTLIATAMSVAVAGPAAADVPDGSGERYEDTNATVQISPSGCKNVKEEFNAVVGFGSVQDFEGFDFAFPFAGCWAMTGYSFDDVGYASGLRIARKSDTSNSDSRGDAKDLTMSLSGDTLYDGIVDAMDNYLEIAPDADKCDYVDNGDIYEYAVVKKAQGKFSKNQEKLKVDIQVESKYENTKGKMKNVKAKVKANLDAKLGENPAFDCGAFFVQPI